MNWRLHLLAHLLAIIKWDKAEWMPIAKYIASKKRNAREIIVVAESLRAIASRLRVIADELLEDAEL